MDIYLISITLVIHGFWYIYSDKFFNKFITYRELDYDKQLYVKKNIIKFFWLLYIFNYSVIDAYRFFVKDNTNNGLIKNIAIMYCLPDLCSLIYIRKLPISTKIHHITVVILGLIFLLNDYKDWGYLNGVIVYCFFSICSGFVNFYLGWRYIHNNPNHCKIAYYNYIICLLIIWCYQIYNIYFRYEFTYGFYLYIICCINILYDDIKLISFLKYNTKKITRRY